MTPFHHQATCTHPVAVNLPINFWLLGDYKTHTHTHIHIHTHLHTTGSHTWDMSYGPCLEPVMAETSLGFGKPYSIIQLHQYHT